MKNIFVGYERGSGISPYFAGAKARNLSFPLFKKAGLSHRFIVLAMKLYAYHLPFFYLALLGKWKKELGNTAEIIFTASREALPALDFLHHHYPKIKCHVFYLNTLDTEVADLTEWSNAHCEIWTFDKDDAEKFGLHLTTQPICKESFEHIFDEEIRYDVTFVGEDKGRLPILVPLKKALENQQLTTNFHITCTYEPNRSIGFDYDYAEPLAYEKVLQFYAQSRAVIEILQTGQKGSTMRTLEASYLGKKLITNNQDVVHEPYFHPNNIFVLTGNNASEIADFMKKDFVKIFDYGYYEMEEWLKRLGNYNDKI